jgi:hypothetical protein
MKKLIVLLFCGVLSACAPVMFEDPNALFRTSGPTKGLRKVFAPSINEIHSVCDQAFSFGAGKSTGDLYYGEYPFTSGPDSIRLFSSLAGTRFSCLYGGLNSIVKSVSPDLDRKYATFFVPGKNLDFKSYSLELKLFDASSSEIGSAIPRQENYETGIFFRFTELTESTLKALDTATSAQFELKSPQGLQVFKFIPPQKTFPDAKSPSWLSIELGRLKSSFISVLTTV